MEVFTTKIKLRQFYEEMKEPLAFDNFQDFIDYVIRTELVQLQEIIAARSLA